MPSSKASVQTQHASKYLQQLCKHFAHKVEVHYDPHEAYVAFPFGNCRIWAKDHALTIECGTNSEEDLQRARVVIDDHLTRFAWREKPEIIWVPAR